MEVKIVMSSPIKIWINWRRRKQQKESVQELSMALVKGFTGVEKWHYQ